MARIVVEHLDTLNMKYPKPTVDIEHLPLPYRRGAVDSRFGIPQIFYVCAQAQGEFWTRNFCLKEQTCYGVERILCPIGFSEFSARAYDYAQSLAWHYQAKLFLNHVVDFGLPPYEYYAPAVDLNEVFRKTCADARYQLLESAKSLTKNGVQPECFVQEGAVTDAILSFAETQGVDLIVMGTHGRKGFDRVTLGSVAEKVLRKACCPVLVVRKPGPDVVASESAQSSSELRRVIFCTDFSDSSHRALDYALSAAAEFDAELALLHVLEDIPNSARGPPCCRRRFAASQRTGRSRAGGRRSRRAGWDRKPLAFEPAKGWARPGCAPPAVCALTAAAAMKTFVWLPASLVTMSMAAMRNS